MEANKREIRLGSRRDKACPVSTSVLRDLNDTERFGLMLGRQSVAGDVITLDGDLGSGKTALAQFIGRGLGVPENCYITSPTFGIIHEYAGSIPLYHMDLYRLGYDDLEELGLEDYLYGNGLCVIEWPERLEDLTPANRLHIDIRLLSENSRAVTLTAHGTFQDRLPTLRDGLPGKS